MSNQPYPDGNNPSSAQYPYGQHASQPGNQYPSAPSYPEQPAPGYGQPMGSYPPQAYPQQALPWQKSELQTNLESNATVVLVLGILSIFLTGIFTSIVAWVWGDKILKEAAANNIPPDAVMNAKIGKIIGMVITILNAVVLVMVIGMIVFGISLFGLST